MKLQRLTFSLGCALVAATPLSPARAADHLDSPSVQADGKLDINDLYAFQSPADPANTVLVMTVNPLAGVQNATTFSSRGVYEFNIDNNGDDQADVRFSCYFSKPRADGAQNILVLREDRSVFAKGRTATTLSPAGGGRLRADLFDDPFFFDLAGFQNGFQFTGTDFFAGLNVTAIVLEVPSSLLGGPNVAVWATTASGGRQFDRMGRPAINTALIPGAMKDAFNRGVPADDFAAFGLTVQASIEGLNGGDSATAAAIASVLLPDVLTIDISNAAGFLNGRALADDVIDAELGLLSNGAVTTDGVNTNDKAFLTVFPYLAPAN